MMSEPGPDVMKRGKIRVVKVIVAGSQRNETVSEPKSKEFYVNSTVARFIGKSAHSPLFIHFLLNSLSHHSPTLSLEPHNTLPISTLEH